MMIPERTPHLDVGVGFAIDLRYERLEYLVEDQISDEPGKSRSTSAAGQTNRDTYGEEQRKIGKNRTSRRGHPRQSE
jgi:hypothetical protein